MRSRRNARVDPANATFLVRGKEGASIRREGQREDPTFVTTSFNAEGAENAELRRDSEKRLLSSAPSASSAFKSSQHAIGKRRGGHRALPVLIERRMAVTFMKWNELVKRIRDS